jgi:putative addiction module CopG family antidote
MAREATISVSLTPEQLRLVRQRVESGRYASASEVIRESLGGLFVKGASEPARERKRSLAAAYMATAGHDRKQARDWAQVAEAWPEK